MGVENLTIANEEKMKIFQKLTAAINNNDTDGYLQALSELTDNIIEKVKAEYEEIGASADTAVLAQRGVRQLTGTETKYYNKVIEAMRSGNPKQSITLIDEVMPTTIVDEIFKYIKENHPLLSEIDVKNVGAITRFISATTGGEATWGELCDPIDSEITGSFAVLDMTLNKLFAKMIVCSPMLDLGPVWMHRFTVEAMGEKLAVGLELGFVDGDGKNKPIGMTRALSGATDGVYPRKTPVALTSFDPVAIGNLLNTISQGPNGTRRVVPELLMVVNPTDYYTKVYPATTVRRTDGGYNKDVFPYPVKVAVSAAVPDNRMVIGLAKEYFAASGAGTNGGKLEYSDDVKFLEDARAYRIKMYANGRARDENAFVLADITDLKPTVLQVEVVGKTEGE